MKKIIENRKKKNKEKLSTADIVKMFKENNYIDLDRYTIKDIQSINDMMCIEQ